MELMKTLKKNLIQSLSVLKRKKRAHLEKKELMDKMGAMEVTGKTVCGVRLATGAMEGMRIRSEKIDTDRVASEIKFITLSTN
jgi:hypothetical protein